MIELQSVIVKEAQMKRDCSNPAATAWFFGLMENPERFPFRFTCGGTAYKGLGAPLVPAGSSMETEGEKTRCPSPSSYRKSS